jgi:tRNA-splicing ligase RtcB
VPWEQFIYKWVAAMPDVHWGIGATVGSVIPTRGAIIPAAVGVDIGCGMMAVKTSLHANHLPDNLHGIRTAIEKAVPHGRTDNGRANDRGAWSDAPSHHAEVWAKMEPAYKAIVEKYPKLDHKQRVNHLGTLGTGNHFIEVCLDENENVWFLLHSGSRGVGNRFGTFFIELAKNDMRQWMINLPDQDLAYLPQGTEHFEDYVRAVHWAQDYALANRELMMRNLIAAVQGSGEVPAFEANVEVVSCHHNYVTWEHHYGEKARELSLDPSVIADGDSKTANPWNAVRPWKHTSLWRKLPRITSLTQETAGRFRPRRTNQPGGRTVSAGHRLREKPARPHPAAA